MGRPSSIAKLVCSDCGASADAACNCGVAYVPASKRAEAAIKDNPSKSDRAVAADTGVSRRTVQRARRKKRAGGSHEPRERTGNNGKTYKVPERDRYREMRDATNQLHRELAVFREKFVGKVEQWKQAYKAEITQEAINCLNNILWNTADCFNCLAQELDGRPCEGPPEGALVLQ